MAIFREVEVYPHGGFVDRPWSPEPDEDAFVRIARGVCEVYSEALPLLILQSKASLLRLSCHGDHGDYVELALPGADDPISAAVTVGATFLGSYEYGHVRVPVGFARLTTVRQRVWALDAAHEAARRLALVRGWDPVVLDAARRHAVARELRYLWEGPWKSAPDRRHKARGVVGIRDNGIGWVRLDVATRAGEAVAGSEEVSASCDAEDLRWMCKTIRWHSSTQVTMMAAQDPYGWGPQKQVAVTMAGAPSPPTRQRQVRSRPPRRPAQPQ